jgi:hypothetical protein
LAETPTRSFHRFWDFLSTSSNSKVDLAFNITSASFDTKFAISARNTRRVDEDKEDDYLPAPRAFNA